MDTGHGGRILLHAQIFFGVYAIFLPALGVVCFFIPQNYTKSGTFTNNSVIANP